MLLSLPSHFAFDVNYLHILNKFSSYIKLSQYKIQNMQLMVYDMQWNMQNMQYNMQYNVM